MVHNDVVCSKKSNCVDTGTKILTVSSRPAKRKTDEDEDLPVDGDEDDDLLNPMFLEDSQYVDDIYEHSIACMASVIEKRIISAKRGHKIVKCDQCVMAFIENQLIDDSFIRFKSRDSNVLQPCKSTFDICKFVDSNMKTFEGKSIPYETVALKILRRIKFDNLFAGTNFENHPKSPGKLTGHRYDLVKKIIDLYMHMKSVENAKRFTLKIHEKRMRHTYKKLVQQKGE